MPASNISLSSIPPDMPTSNISLSSIRPDILALDNYQVPVIPEDHIKLDAMENPYPLSEELKQELGTQLADIQLNRYPTKILGQLATAIEAYIGHIPDDYQLMVGNGSDELIDLWIKACAHRRACVVSPEPSFVMYKRSCLTNQVAYIGVDLHEDFSLNLEAMLATIHHHRPGLVFLSFPNNPTGTLWAVEDMREIIDEVSRYGGIVAIDEAYEPFSNYSWLTEILHFPKDNQQVVLIRTLSKWGLAGVRIGYSLAPKPLQNQLEKLRPPYNVSVLNAQCALFALHHADFFRNQTQEMCQQRDWLLKELHNHAKFRVIPSHGNMFLLNLHDTLIAEQVYEALKRNRIWVKNVSNSHPLLRGCLRISVGTPTENLILLESLKKIIGF